MIVNNKQNTNFKARAFYTSKLPQSLQKTSDFRQHDIKNIEMPTYVVNQILNNVTKMANTKNIDFIKNAEHFNLHGDSLKIQSPTTISIKHGAQGEFGETIFKRDANNNEDDYFDKAMEALVKLKQ